MFTVYAICVTFSGGVADTDLELREGRGEGILFCLPCQLFFLLYFLLFLPQGRRGGGGGRGGLPRSTTDLEHMILFKPNLQKTN